MMGQRRCRGLPLTRNWRFQVPSHRTCSIENCARRHYARGWCESHYKGQRSHGLPVLVRPTAETRYWENVDTSTGPDGCWPWMGTMATTGYGRLKIGAKVRVQAHRFGYELQVGPVPVEYHIDHLCRNRACQNVKHLEAVTEGENIRRGIGPSAQNARKTHCKNGHPFDDENTRRDEKGHRTCIACSRVYYYTKKARK